MRVLAYIPLHYGAEYLRESILSINDRVDKIIILYSEKPSFGFGTEIECPESEQKLKEIAFEASDKVSWERVNFGSEGDHRKYIFKYANGFDLILAVDADEIWDDESLWHCLRVAADRREKYYGIDGFINFWRSFNHVCLDGFCPIRIINLHALNEEQAFIKGKIYHFSCAQSEEIMDYKYLIHGHKDEIRPGWLENTYKKWKQGTGDLHPVAIGLWNAVDFDKNTLPLILKLHPNFNKEVI